MARFLLIALLIGIFCITPRKTHATSLKQAVEDALKSNPKFSSAINTKNIADEQLKQSKALYRPSLDLRAETGYESTATPVISDEELYKQQISLTMTQLLFDGSGTTNTINRQKYRLKAAEYRQFEAAEFTALNVTNSFLNVIRRRELMKTAEKNIQDHTKILNKIRDGAENGKFNKGDLAQVISRVARAKASFESIKQSVTEAEANYKNIVGTLPSNTLEKPNLDNNNLPDNVIKLITQAQEINPSLATVKESINAATANYKRSKSNHLPIVELQLSGTKGSDTGGIKGDETLGSALMVMRWNLFRGGADKSRTREAFFQQEIAKDDEVNALRELENNIRTTWAIRVAAINQTKEFEQQITANKKVVEVYQDQFKLNRRSLLDLLNTQNELFLSENNHINSSYSKIFADFRLIALRGDLLKTLGIEEPFKEQKPIKLAKMKTDILPNSVQKDIAAKAPILFKPPINEAKLETTTNKDYYIQFGAFQNRLEAEKMLDIISDEHSDLLGNLTKRIQKADLGEKGIYYRLQAGAVTKTTGSDLCVDLNIRDTRGCFIVKK